MQLLGAYGSAERVTLDLLPIGVPARIARIDWAQLVPEEAQRLRAMGIDVGALVELSYRGVFFSRDPIALKIGRMTLALRRIHACAMEVEPVSAEAAA